MNLDSRAIEKNAGFCDEMLPKVVEHLVRGPFTNEEVQRRIQAAIWEYDELLKMVKKQKLRWLGHVSMYYGLTKTILQVTVSGKKKKI